MKQLTAWPFQILLVFAIGCVEEPPDVVLAPLNEGPGYDIEDGRALTYELRAESSVSIACKDGKCEQFQSPARTNLRQDAYESELDRRAASSLVEMQATDTEAAEQNKSEVLQKAQALRGEGAGSEMLRFSIWLIEDDWDLGQLQGAVGGRREALINERKAVNSLFQREVVDLVEELDGRVVAQRWLTNSLAVEVPAESVDRVLSHPLVYSAYLPADVSPTAAGDGADRYAAFSAFGISQTGSTGGNLLGGFGPIVMCVLEAGESGNGIQANHLGWLSVPGGASRLVKSVACTASTCSASTAAPTNVHGTVVASIAAGSILNGQDPAFPGAATTSQRARSGVLSNSVVHFYRSSSSIASSNSDQMAKAIEQAVADGCDVLNNSWQFHGAADWCLNNCSNSYNPSGIRAEMAAAEDAGTVLIVAAGNSHDKGCNQSCDVVFPAVVPDALSVGALADTNFSNYRSVNLASYSSRGSIPVTLKGGSSGSMPAVGLTAFGHVRTSFGLGPASYHVMTFGTSFAAPQVASLAGSFRQWMSNANIAMSSSAWAVMINTLLMGDGWCGPTCNAVWEASSGSGYGFPKYFTPTGTFLGGNAGWGTRTFTITQGQTVAWTVNDPGQEGNDVNGWKWALAVDTTSTSNLPRLNMRVVDTCNNDQIVEWAPANRATRFRIMLTDPSQIRGKCLEMRVTGVEVKSGGETIWSADYYFTNNASNHMWLP